MLLEGNTRESGKEKHINSSAHIYMYVSVCIIEKFRDTDVHLFRFV